MPEMADFPVLQTVNERTVEVVKVIPQERVPERTVEQIVDVAVEIPRARVQQRTVEFELQSPAFVEHETGEGS